MARRMNGEGLLRKRPDGRWELRVMNGYREKDGKPNYKCIYGRTKREVTEKFKEFKKKLNGGIDVNRSYTFAEWSTIWFERHQRRITPTTADHYQCLLKKLVAKFGDRNIYEINTWDVEEFFDELKDESKSDSYISSCRGLLFQIFKKAKANNLVLKNPVEDAETVKSDTPALKKVKDSFTAEEVRKLMQQLPKDQIGLGIRLMIGTGMRTQELLALEPSLIKEDGSVIHIWQAVKLDNGKVYVGDTKNTPSYRDVPVPLNLRWCAMELRKAETRYIFERGKEDVPCNPSYFRDKYKEAISKVEGVRMLTPHCCRHTYVSQMQAVGVPMATIRSLVGHASETMTQHYLHVQEEVKKEAVQKFSDAFSQN